MPAADPDALKAYSFTLFSKLEGAVTALMVHLGDRLGLYRALAAADEPAHERRAGRRAPASTSAGCGSGCTTRARPGCVAYDDDGIERFWLTPEAAVVTADADSPYFGLGMFLRLPSMSVHDRAAAGVVPHRRGLRLRRPRPRCGRQRRGRAWRRGTGTSSCRCCCRCSTAWWTGCAPAGAAVDIGCGSGLAVLTIADGVPGRHGRGLRHLDAWRWHAPRPTAHRVALTNASFHDARVDPLPTDGSADLVDHVRLHPRHDAPAGDDGDDPRGDRARRHVAARRHQGPRHVRRERRQEPDGVDDVRRVGDVVHVVGAVGARRRRARHARACPSHGPGRWRRRPGSPASASSASTTRSTRSTRSAPSPINVLARGERKTTTARLSPRPRSPRRR